MGCVQFQFTMNDPLITNFLSYPEILYYLWYRKLSGSQRIKPVLLFIVKLPFYVFSHSVKCICRRCLWSSAILNWYQNSRLLTSLTIRLWGSFPKTLLTEFKRLNGLIIRVAIYHSIPAKESILSFRNISDKFVLVYFFQMHTKCVFRLRKGTLWIVITNAIFAKNFTIFNFR